MQINLKSSIPIAGTGGSFREHQTWTASDSRGAGKVSIKSTGKLPGPRTRVSREWVEHPSV